MQPKCKSIEELTEAITDDLIPLKLSFFSYMASLLQPFLKKYQSDKPLIPYLYDDLTKVLKVFLETVKMCVTSTVSKLIEKCPLNSVIIRSSRIFNPSLICAENKVSLMKMMKVLTQKLHRLKIIDANCGDKAYDQNGEFIDKNFSFNCDDDDRLDNLFFQNLNISSPNLKTFP